VKICESNRELLLRDLIALTAIQKVYYSGAVLSCPKRKTLFIASASFIIFSILLAIFVVAINTDHDCTGEACSPCTVIKAANYFLNNIKLVILVVLFAVTIVFQIQKFEDHKKFNTCIYSPVILKVRLNT